MHTWCTCSACLLYFLMDFPDRSVNAVVCTNTLAPLSTFLCTLMANRIPFIVQREFCTVSQRVVSLGPLTLTEAELSKV